jgi:hypothetical protein
MENMANKKIKVARGGMILGDFSSAEILRGLQSGAILPSDYYWDAPKQSWLTVANAKLEANPNEPDISSSRPAKKPGTSTPHSPKGKQDNVGCGILSTLKAAAITLVAFIAIGKGAIAVYDELGYNPVASMPWSSSTREDYDFVGFGVDGKELFPSGILAYSGISYDSDINEDLPEDAAPVYSDSFPDIQVGVSGVRKGDVFEVTVSGDRFVKPSSIKITSETEDKIISIAPTVIYDYAALASLRQTVPFNVTYTIKRSNEKPKTYTETWMAHQLNDCQTSSAGLYLTNTGKLAQDSVPTEEAFAGFVNENHPWVDAILKDALATKRVRAFVGYQGTTEDVLGQVEAVWLALKSKGLAYSNIAKTTNSDLNSFQHVRFIDESISSSQANCIDGCVVLASIFRKIDLNVSIALVPGHAYVVVLNKKGNRVLFAIETTMLASENLAAAIDYATDSGPQSFNKIRKKFTDENHPEFVLINIDELRKMGVSPIPFTR